MPIETRVVSGSRSSFNPTVETSNSTTNVNALRDEANSTFEVRPDALSYADILLLVPELGRIVYDTTNETERYYDGSSWQSMSGTSSSVGQRAANFTSLTGGSTVGELAYVNQSQGTPWLPGSFGGTYKPKGWYVWNGTDWISDRENLVNQLQLNVDGLGGKANVGDIRTDVQINALIDANTNGYVTTDNNTQLSDGDIAAFGYVKTDNDTQLTDGDISALGYVKTDNNTQLSDGDIAAFGYVKTDNDTQLTDSEIEALGYIKVPAVLPLAKGGALNLEQALLAADGQPAKTILAVANTTSGKVQGCSLGNGNVVEVYADGDDYNSATVLYREFMQAGEPICFTGLSAGAIITSTQGFYGFSEQVNGSHVSPMPLMSLGLAFTDTFCYAFRDSGSALGTGKIYIVCGPLPAEVTLTKNGVVVESQENISIQPFELLILGTNSASEYRITATSPVMGAIQARVADADIRFFDARLVMPTTNDGITWPRSGFVSAPYDNTVVDYYVRDGASGDFTVSPGSAIDFDGAAGTGANDSDYEPAGATRVLAKGLISAYSGADSSGLEASPLMPTAAMSQVVAQPLFIHDSGDGGDSGVAIASPYTGTAKVYEWNSVTGVADLAYTVALNKGFQGAGVTLTTPEDQNFPASGIVANEGGLAADSSYVELIGNLGAGYIVADVPITVVVQNSTPSHIPTLRSQNGTTTTGIVSNDDETLTLGWTPPDLKAEITRDASGYLRKRVIDASGVTTYVLV
tara:strand:- start:621 stop:2864 length:2244 start_codon:yes stop_codon:yes gene_type:complete